MELQLKTIDSDITNLTNRKATLEAEMVEVKTITETE